MTKHRILLVEDSSFFAGVLTRKLTERGGFAVDRVESFAQARAYLDSEGQDLFAALLDLHLPDSPRGEVVDHFVARGVPSIVFTGDFNENVRDVVMSKNVVDYVLKEGPDSLNEVVAALERLERNREIKVLVVDDSPSARSTICGLLRTHQYQVLEADDGEAALQVFRTNGDIRLLITDYAMPGMDGVELVRTVRASNPREKLAVIALSAENNPLISARFIKSGANDFLRKPFIVEEFHCRIRQNMEILEYIEKVRIMAEQDYLTGLHNRRHFIRRARRMHAEARERGYPLLAALLDIDHFKQVNDTYGHDAGDQVLRDLGRKLQERFGRDGLVARYGGEEFALLLPGMPEAQACTRIEHFLDAVAKQPAPTSAGDVGYTVSAGLSGEAGADLEEMLRFADEQLYRAKQNGRNRLCSLSG